VTSIEQRARKVTRFVRRFSTGPNAARSNIEPPPQIQAEPSKLDIASRKIMTPIPAGQPPAFVPHSITPIIHSDRLAER
jgi:hypothetical protein